MDKKVYLKFISNDIIKLFKSQNKLDLIYDELKNFLAFLKKSKELQKIIKYDELNNNTKMKILYSILKSHFSIHFIKLVIYLLSENLLALIDQFFNSLKIQKDKNYFTYNITVPHAISYEEENYLKNSLSKKHPEHFIKYKIIINPEILGGIIIYNKTSFTLLDLSILGKINRLKIHYGNK